MNRLRQHIANLIDQDREQAIKSFEEFEREGVTGEFSPIRVLTKAYMQEENIPPHLIVLMMREFASECYRYYAVEYFRYRV